MKAPIAMALAMSFASTGALAPAQAIQAFETGNDLYRKCPSTHCRSYVAGVVDALWVFANARRVYTFCVPETVTSIQITDMYINYLRDNPSERHHASASTILAMLEKKFPCPRRKRR